MSFIRRKVVKGRTYLYEVENYRDPQTGKTKQKVKQYLGRDPRDRAREEAEEVAEKLGTTNQSCCCQTTPLSLGDRVRIEMYLDGEIRQLEGVVVRGSTQVEACRWPKGKRIVYEIVRCPYDPPNAVSVEFEWNRQTIVVQMPKAKVRKV